jgi:hypothetical protein
VLGLLGALVSKGKSHPPSETPEAGTQSQEQN